MEEFLFFMISVSFSAASPPAPGGKALLIVSINEGGRGAVRKEKPRISSPDGIAIPQA
jgi:hypothetical protein